MTTNDTKRRLLLSKWETARETEREHDDEIAELQHQVDQLETVISTAMYWMQDVLILHKPMTDPRKILTMLERSI